MSQLPQNAPLRDTESLRRQIAARKRFDLLFGWLGLLLISGALLVLFLLGINLVIDGWGPLWQRHEVKADKSAFGLREVAGTLRRREDQWLLQLDRLIVLADPAVLAPLDGQRVDLVGRLPRGTKKEIETESIAPAGERPAGTLSGVLRSVSTKDEAGKPVTRYEIEPDPLLVDLSGTDQTALQEGRRYAFTVKGRPSEGKVVATEVVPLKTRSFFTSYPSRFPEEAGILSAWVGTLLIMLVTMVLAVPLGVAAGIYLEEYAPRNRLTAIIEVNIANLAGVPSIIWGLMALGLFVYILNFGRSILTAGMTLGLLVLPIVIIATREAIRSIPQTIREAAIGLGATKWQTIRYHILPYSLSGILTGAIIALSRAIGETAPLVTIGALTFIAFLPPPPVEYRVSAEDRAAYESALKTDPNAPAPSPKLHFQPFAWLKSGYTVMPIQLFQWVSRPQKAFHENAAAAGIVLLVMTLGLNGVAIFLRYRLRRSIKW
ncbi:MAG: phosphate ABC transporter permease PstA [Phycisphaerales bacterium]|nr:phosphate ABC transporter permease PstA [Phycisphaerales bacterium]